MKKIVVFTLVVVAFLVFFSLPSLPKSNGIILHASFLAAFFGGVISIFSPCSAALLPAFFAYSFTTKTKLIAMTFIFWLGLVTIFVPLSFSASLVSKLFLFYRTQVFWGAGIIFIALGVVTLLPPGWFRVPALRLPAGKNVGSVYLMGLLFAFASGTCTAPILGGILTLAATQATAFTALVLLLTYSFGLVIPLFFLAYFFERYRLAERGWFRTHTKGITALLLFGIGILFITTKGTNSLLLVFTGAGLTDFYFDLNEQILAFSRSIPNVIVVTATIVVGVVLFFYKKKLNSKRKTL